MADGAPTTAEALEADDKPQTRLSVSTLQCQLQALFRNSTPRRAIREAMSHLGLYVGASYTVVHARIGVQMISEEWAPQPLDADDPLRQSVNTIMWDAVSAGAAKCVRLRQLDQPAAAVAAAVLFDENAEEAGAAAMVIPDCDHDRALEILSWFEGIVGYLALLTARHGSGELSSSDAARSITRQSNAAEHPIRLAIGMAAELKNHHDLDTAAIGFVSGRRVEVVAVSGMDQLRKANPGIGRIRSAMEECLDFREAVICPGSTPEGDAFEGCRLHAQWSAAVNGLAVASFPLFLGEDIVAIVSVIGSSPSALQRGEVHEFAEEMADYAPLVAMSRAASRGLLSHTIDRAGAFLRTVTRGRKAGLTAAACAAVGLWLIFGRLPYSLTVPCVVKATAHQTVASPREGVLQELFAKPGDIVRKGQLLAILDAHEDVLEREELQAEIETVRARADKALEDGEAGEGRILAAQQRSLETQLAAVEQSIAQAEIRAPQAGVILRGDLREQLGSRLSLGDPLFELVRDDRMVVTLRIPENMVLDARENVHAMFSPAARPEETFELKTIWIEPASTVLDGKNVFMGEAETNAVLGRLAPGMEGVAHLELESRSAWWVLTHRVTHWLKLRFWL